MLTILTPNLINSASFIFTNTDKKQSQDFILALLLEVKGNPSYLQTLKAINKELDKKYLFKKVGYSLKSFYTTKLKALISGQELEAVISFLTKPEKETDYFHTIKILEKAAKVQEEGEPLPV